MFLTAKYQNSFLQKNSFLTQAVIVVISSLILAASAQIMIPWQPVPLTFQSAMVVLLGLALGPQRALAAVLLYLTEAAAGLPVLAGFAGGLTPLFGASVGYLFAFIPAAYLAGWLMEQGMAKSFSTTFITALISASVIFLGGVLHLQALFGWAHAFDYGVKPFLATEPLKLAIAAAIATRFWK